MLYMKYSSPQKQFSSAMTPALESSFLLENQNKRNHLISRDDGTPYSVILGNPSKKKGDLFSDHLKILLSFDFQ